MNQYKNYKKTILSIIAGGFVFVGLLGTGTLSAHAWDTPPSMTAVATVPSSGTLAPGQQLEVYLTAANQEDGMTVDGPCTINNVTVSPLQDLGSGLYELVYTVGANDASRTAGQIPIMCTLIDQDNQTVTVSSFTDGNTVAIDTSTGTSTGTTTNTGGGGGNTEGAPSITDVAAVPSSGTLGVGDSLDVYLTAANQENDLTLGGACTINDVAVSPLDNDSGGLYKLTYTVGPNDTNRAAGQIPISCDVTNSSGSATIVNAFTDNNTVAIDTGTGTSTGTTTNTGGGGGNNGGGTGTTTTATSTSAGSISFSQVAAVPSSGTLQPGDSLDVYLTDASSTDSDLSLGNSCTINNVQVSPLDNDSGGLYQLTYTVGTDDMSQVAGQVPIDCMIQNATGASTTVTAFTDNNTVAIDAATSTATSTNTGGGGGNNGGGTGTTTNDIVLNSIDAVPASGTLMPGDSLDVYITAANQESDLTLGGTCTVNGVNVGPLQNESDGLYELTYTVGANDMSQTAGMVPIDCDITNGTGSSTVVTAFTDNNTVAIDAAIGTGGGGTGTTTTGTSTGSTTGTLTGTVSGGSQGDAPLSVTSITPVQTAATADESYGDGWSWTFNVTVPNDETNLQMEFGDWTNTADASDTIPVAGNMQISSPQASQTTPIGITGSNVYTMPLSLTTDADPNTPGRQVQVTVEMKIPTTTVNGSYTTNYGVQSY